MDFEFDDDQKIIKETIDRFVADRYSFQKRKTYLESATGWSKAVWAELAELGLLGLPFEEAHGGAGKGAVEVAIVMEAFGRHITLEPYLPTVIVAGSLIEQIGSDAQKEDILPRIACGDAIVTLAHAEMQSRYDLDAVNAKAQARGGGWTVSGMKIGCRSGDSADLFLVSARTDSGISLFVVDARLPGIELKPYVLHDGRRAADVTFSDVQVPGDALIGREGGALSGIERSVEHAISAMGAEGVGVLDAMVSKTCEYLGVRKQFGVPIGSFQALQHRAVEMLIELEQLRSMSFFGSLQLGNPDEIKRRSAIAALKVQLAKSCRFVGQQALQLHGGIGQTMDLDVGHYFMRANILEREYGDLDFHIQRVAALGGVSVI